MNQDQLNARKGQIAVFEADGEGRTRFVGRLREAREGIAYFSVLGVAYDYPRPKVCECGGEVLKDRTVPKLGTVVKVATRDVTEEDFKPKALATHTYKATGESNTNVMSLDRVAAWAASSKDDRMFKHEALRIRPARSDEENYFALTERALEFAIEEETDLLRHYRKVAREEQGERAEEARREARGGVLVLIVLQEKLDALRASATKTEAPREVTP